MAEKHCDFCKVDLLENWIDGKTWRGPWATMCEACHNAYGLGFGTGKGQLFDKNGKKIAG